MNFTELNASQLKILALIGILILALGAFVPVESESDSWGDQSLFGFDRFDGPNTARSIRNGLTSNMLGICLVGLALATAYAALNFEGLGGMVVSTLVYITLLLYILTQNDTSMSWGWLLLYGGWAMIAVASYLHSQLPKAPLSATPSQPAANLGEFEPPSE